MRDRHATIKCPRCGGSGMVGHNPSPINDPQMEVSEDCPACRGDGIVVACQATNCPWPATRDFDRIQLCDDHYEKFREIGEALG